MGTDKSCGPPSFILVGLLKLLKPFGGSWRLLKAGCAIGVPGRVGPGSARQGPLARALHPVGRAAWLGPRLARKPWPPWFRASLLVWAGHPWRAALGGPGCGAPWPWAWGPWPGAPLALPAGLSRNGPGSPWPRGALGPGGLARKPLARGALGPGGPWPGAEPWPEKPLARGPLNPGPLARGALGPGGPWKMAPSRAEACMHDADARGLTAAWPGGPWPGGPWPGGPFPWPGGPLARGGPLAGASWPGGPGSLARGPLARALGPGGLGPGALGPGGPWPGGPLAREALGPGGPWPGRGRKIHPKPKITKLSNQPAWTPSPASWSRNPATRGQGAPGGGAGKP